MSDETRGAHRGSRDAYYQATLGKPVISGTVLHRAPRSPGERSGARSPAPARVVSMTSVGHQLPLTALVHVAV